MTEGARIIQAFLLKNGWTQKKLADEIGRTRVTVANLLRGIPPQNETLIALRKIKGLGHLVPEHFENGKAA